MSNNHIKWKIKALIQNILSIVPFGVQLNYLLQKHVTKAYTTAAMINSYNVQIKQIDLLNRRESIENKRILEIGPGWFSISGLIFWLLKSKSIYWVDIRKNFKLDLTKRYAEALLSISNQVAKDIGVDVLEIQEKLMQVALCQTDSDFFQLCNIKYDAPGDARSIKAQDHTIDLIYSWGVLEHISWDHLCEIFENSVPLLSASGRHYHNIGMQDHFHDTGIGNGVNFLKYSSVMWKLIAGNQFAFHNRKRKTDYLKLIDNNNFKINYHWEELLEINLSALDKIKVHKEFQGYTREELACSHLLVEFGK